MRRTKFGVRRYGDTKRPKLKFVVSGRENGKRTRRFFTTKGEADTYAQAKNIELRNKGTEGAEFPSWLRVMAEDCNARLAQRGRTIKDATEFFLRHLVASEKSCTASELVTKLIAAKQTDGASERYLSDLRGRLTRFADDLNGQVVATITTAQIDDWLRGLKLSATSRNNYRRVLILSFNFAKQGGYATDNPAETTARAKPRNEAPGILTVSATARLLENATPDLLPYLALGAFAGLRRAELQRLDWQEINFDDGLIEVMAKKAKTARHRFVRMQPNLREWLLPVRKHSGAVLCDNFRRRFDETRVAAGIAEWPDNALRHSFASYHLAHFRDAAALALEMGHANSGMIFEHYRELVRPKDAERFWSIRPAASGSKVVRMIAPA